MSLLNENPVHQESFLASPILKWIIVAIIFLIACVIAYFAYKAFYAKETTAPSVASERQEKLEALYEVEAVPAPLESGSSLSLQSDENNTDGFSGYIVFTGMLRNGGVTNEVFFIDPSSPDPKAERFLPDFVKYSAFAEFTDIFTPVEFFVDAMYYAMTDYQGDTPPSNHSIQKYNMNDGTLKAYKSLMGDYVQNMDWSEAARKLAFVRQSERPSDYLDLLEIENWEVNVANIDTDSVDAVFKESTEPYWSPDGTKLLLLKSDGLYVVDVATKKETNVVPVTEGKLLATSMIDVSPDGSRLAWTHGKQGVISMYEISSWEPFEIKEIGRIETPNTEYFWPQFSPDGKHYVVQAIDPAKEGAVDRENPRFEIRATLGQEILWAYSLSRFDFNTFFTDAWIQTLPRPATNQ